MTNNTALQELIEWLRIETWGFEQPSESGRSEIDPIKIFNKATELLEKEKNIIADAYRTGKAHERYGTLTETNMDGEEYYNDKFLNTKHTNTDRDESN